MYLILVAHFDLDLQVFALALAIFLGATHGLRNASGEVHMVVLYEYHVKQTDAVVGSASDLHGLFFEQTHSGGRLAGVEHFSLQSCQTLLIAGRGGGYAAHALHDVEHGALCLEQGSYASLHLESHIAGLHVRAVGKIYGHFQFRIEILEYFACYLHSGEYSLFLDYEALASAGVGRDR